MALDVHVGSPNFLGSDPPRALLDGIALAARSDAALSVVLTGRVPDDWRQALDAWLPWAVLPGEALRDLPGEDPARSIRAHRAASVRLAARAVRDHRADAAVLLGPLGTAVTAATFALPRAPGITTTPAAAILRTPAGPVVLLDVGVPSDGQAAALAQAAVLGSQLAAVMLGCAEPRVGLLRAAGVHPALDPVRARARELLGAYVEAGLLPAVHDVSADELGTGGPTDVVVTDGFSGNVLRAGLTGAPGPPADFVPHGLDSTILLGLEGVVVLSAGHAGPSADSVAGALAGAAAAYRGQLVSRTRVALDAVIAWRRRGAGLPPAAP